MEVCSTSYIYTSYEIMLAVEQTAGHTGTTIQMIERTAVITHSRMMDRIRQQKEKEEYYGIIGFISCDHFDYCHYFDTLTNSVDRS